MKRNPINYLFMLFFTAALALSFNVQSEEAVARVLFSHGEVQAYRDGLSARSLSRGDMLHNGETVQTGKASSVQFRFTDGALIALRAETDFAIEQHRYNEQTPEQNEQSSQLLRGGLRAITGAIGRDRPEAVNMRTPVATIGIRGTVYETFYIPPEGHPALPGVAPGHYLLILRGRVAMINAAGELVLADGEIGYTPNADTPPTLRPDLAGLFAQFAALDSEEELVVVQLDGDGSNPETGDIDNVLTETATGTSTVSPGPLAFVILQDTYIGGNNTLVGKFLNQPVEMSGSELISASDGSGDLTSFQQINPALDQGSHTAGDSTINWGWHMEFNGNFSANDSSGNPVSMDWEASYITATQVLLNTSDLPTTGSYSYSYVGGSGHQLVNGGTLSVDFGNATMSASLSDADLTWQTSSPQAISNFYNNGLLLNSLDGPGTIAGRFVGTNADGAMSYFVLEGTDGAKYTGTAAFAR